MLRQGAGAGRQAVYDHIVIAGWAGRPPRRSPPTNPCRRPPPCPPTSSWRRRAYRDLRRWPEALAAYRAGLRRHPGQTAFAAGEIMTLADAGQTEAALAAGQAWVKRAPRDADARLALGYVHARLRQPYEALHQADQALAIAPGTPYVLREYIDALSRARLAQRRWTWPASIPTCSTPPSCAGWRATRWPSRSGWPPCRRAPRPSASPSPTARWRATTR
ncbi:tetratricopeptide repeat protein [Achromobacter insuavis]